MEKREGKEQFQHFDIAAYSKKTFGMFAGKEETVTLRCDRSLTGVMIDRFGKDVAMRKIDENTIPGESECSGEPPVFRLDHWLGKYRENRSSGAGGGTI